MIKKGTRYLILLVLFISMGFCADGDYLKPGTNKSPDNNSSLKKNAPPGHIIKFKIPQQIGPEVIDEATHAIGIAVHAGTDVTALVPTITLDLPTSTVTPGSGVPNNFTTAQAYIVDGATFYSVNVLQARTASPICAGTSTTISGDTPTPTGTLGWEILDAATNTWSMAPGVNTSPDYQTATLANATGSPIIYTFRRSIDIGFGPTWDSYTDLIVNPTTPISGNIITPPAIVNFCAGDDPGNIAGGPVTGGDGSTYNYQWQISTDGINYTDINLVTGQSYDPPAISATTWYQRTVTSGVCIVKSISNPVKITIQNALAGNTINAPSVTTFCGTGAPGNITGTTPTGGDATTYIYQWQSSADGVNYNNISPAVTSKDYDPGTVTATTYYRRAVTSGTCTTPLYSNAVTITIQTVLANNAITAPATTTFCATGGTATIAGSTSTGGDGVNYAYQWQSSTDGINFNDIPGVTNQNYSPPAITATAYYRRAVTSGTCTTPLYSNAVIITIQPALANNTTTAPAMTTFCATGDAASIVGSTPTGGDGITYVYKWQSSTDGVNYNDITAATSQNYDPPAITVTTYYRRSVTSGACTIPLYSNAVTITIQPPLANNILTAPTPAAFCGSGAPGSITGTTPTGGDGINYTYQWESSTDNTTFSPVTLNGTGKDYTPPSLSITMYYHRIVLGSGTCSTPLVSASVQIHITPPLTVNTIGSPLTTTFCTSVDPAVIPGGFPAVGDGPGTYNYQWQSMVEGSNTWLDIPGANSIDYDSPPIMVTTSLRRNVTSGACMIPLSSNVVKFTIINSPPNISANPVASICSGSRASISVSAPDASLTYNWYDSATRDNLLFQGPVYLTDPLTTSQTFYVEASNGTCSSPIPGSVTVTVNQLPIAPALVTNPVSVCQGSTTILSISNPQAGYTYNWYTAATGGTPVFTNANFTTPPVSGNITYYAEAVNSTGCVSSTRTPVPVSALQLPTVTAQGANVCPGETATLKTDNNDVNVTINWYTTPTGGTPVSTGNSFTTLPINANVTYYAEAVNSTCVSVTRSIAKVQLIQPLPAPVVSVEATVAPNITFSWAAVSEATGYEVSTDGGQTFTDPSSGSNGTTHTVTGLRIGQSVTIIVRATGGVSCQLSSNSIPVTGTTTNPLVDDIFVANAFTPNGDGKNDIVYVHNENIKSLKFYVYDQWGELLYASQNKQSGWDGTFKGKVEPVGVYVYYLEAIMNDGKLVKKKGTITLLR